jgi:hypothetical protein
MIVRGGLLIAYWHHIYKQNTGWGQWGVQRENYACKSTICITYYTL